MRLQTMGSLNPTARMPLLEPRMAQVVLLAKSSPTPLLISFFAHSSF